MGPLASDPISEQVANFSTAPLALCPNNWVRSSAVQRGDMWSAVRTCYALSNEDFVDPLISFVGRDYKTMGRVVADKSGSKYARCIDTPYTIYNEPFGGGSGVECSGLGRATGRNITAGDFQLNGIAGSGTTHGVSIVCPSAFRISNTISGRTILVHSCHCAIAIHSLMSRFSKIACATKRLTVGTCQIHICQWQGNCALTLSLPIYS